MRQEKPPAFSSFRSLGVVLAGMMFLAAWPPAVRAQGQGVLRGAVTALGADGEPLFLPGAEVTLHCEGAPGSDRSIQTDETGRFSFVGLPPGPCTLAVHARGFASSTRSVQVTSETPIELTIQLEIAAIEEQVTVSGEANRIEVSQTSAREEIQSSTLQDAPLANERFTDAIPLLPGVVRGPDGLLNIKGARPAQTGLLVNSVNVTDPVTGEYGYNLPIDVVQSVEVLANPYDAQYGKLTGAVTAIQTRSGTDRLKAQVHNFLPRFRRRQGGIRGVEAATPRLGFSGPLKRGKAYFVQSFEYRFIRTRVPGLEHLERDLKNDTSLESFDSYSGVDVDTSPTNRLTFVFSVFPQKLGFVNLNTFNPQETTPNFRQRGFLFGVADRKIFGNQSLLESQFSVKDFDADIFPAGDPSFDMILAPEQNFGSFFNHQHRESRRTEWQELYHFRPLHGGGQHQARLGVNVSRITFRGIHSSNSVIIQRSDETLAERIEFLGDPHAARNSTEVSAFLQDKWNPHRRVTLDFGLRYDYDSVGRQSNLAPRFGFAGLLTSDGRTVFRAGVGLFYDKIPLNVGTFTQLQSRRVTRFAADGITPLGPALEFPHVLANDRLENPRSLAWNAELDREVFRNLFVRFGYQQRQTRRDFLVDPLTDPTPRLQLGNFGRSLYREFQVTARYAIREGSEVVASYTRSRAIGDLNDFNSFFGNFQNPVLRPNERSLLPFDAPNRFIGWGDFRLPKDIIVSPVFEVRDGFPFSLVNANRDFVGPRNRAGRFPTFSSLDLQVTKGFRVPVLGFKMRAGIKVFNLLGHFNPRDVQNNVDSVPVNFRQECASFGQFCNSVGRIFRGKFMFEF